MVSSAASTARPVPWPLQQLGRLFVSALAGSAAALATTTLPRQTRIILSIDVFLLSFTVLTYTLMSVASAEQCAVLARQRAPIRHTGLFASVAASLVGVAAIAVMLHSQKDRASWFRMLHLAGSLLALLLGWIAAQMIFGVQYMRIYYNKVDTPGGEGADHALDFPGQRAPDLWDFMYYAFTIGMCYQTSDVSIRGSTMRRLTLMHAVYSFFFVAAIIGFVVNILSNLA